MSGSKRRRARSQVPARQRKDPSGDSVLRCWRSAVALAKQFGILPTETDIRARYNGPGSASPIPPMRWRSPRQAGGHQ